MWVKDWYGRLHNMNFVTSVYITEGEIFPLVVKFVDSNRNECDAFYIRELPEVPAGLGLDPDMLLAKFLDEFLLYLRGSSTLFKETHDMILMWERFVEDAVNKLGGRIGDSEKTMFKERLIEAVRGKKGE